MQKRVTNNLVPIISKAQFDEEANDFLIEYCPEAIKTPMAVPIMDIACDKMGLAVITDVRLSEDFSIFGQMCFTDGLATIYDKEEDEYRNIKVGRGTMFVDPDTYFLRNLGCVNNTIAHECYHWFRHRNYHTLQNLLDGTQAVACRCPSQNKDDHYTKTWTEEDWMEWQANGIAPRILMPKQTVQTAAESFLNESQSNLFVKCGIMSTAQFVIEKLSDFYGVSKTSVGIRLAELNISTP